MRDQPFTAEQEARIRDLIEGRLAEIGGVLAECVAESESCVIHVPQIGRVDDALVVEDAS